VAPPIGDDPTHKPLKTRLSLDFSSCNRRILVYGLVYDQDPRKCQYLPDGLPYICLVPDQVFGSVNFAECVLRGAVDSFVYMERGDCLCILLIRGICYILFLPPR
jgi:hypothetical protein